MRAPPTDTTGTPPPPPPVPPAPQVSKNVSVPSLPELEIVKKEAASKKDGLDAVSQLPIEEDVAKRAPGDVGKPCPPDHPPPEYLLRHRGCAFKLKQHNRSPENAGPVGKAKGKSQGKVKAGKHNLRSTPPWHSADVGWSWQGNKVRAASRGATWCKTKKRTKVESVESDWADWQGEESDYEIVQCEE